MIDRVVGKTDLRFDWERCAKYNGALPPEEFVWIHDEYTRFWRFFSPIPRRREVQDVEQSIHPFGIWLNGRPTHYKNRPKTFTYHLPQHFSEMKEAQVSISGKFDSFVP
jgi:hypothetical protein